MYKTYIRITDKCNLSCVHCAYNCGPSGRTMDMPTIERVLSHISPSTTHLIFSGGEPLAVKDTLFHALDFLSQNRLELLPNGKVYVETNGFWVRDNKTAFAVFSSLKDHGVDHVSFASFDRYHREQGINTDLLEMSLNSPSYLAIEKIANEAQSHILYPISFENHGAHHGVLPFGRAKTLPQNELTKSSFCSVPWNFRHGSADITVSVDSMVYLCCWEAIPPIGSAIDSHIDDLLAEAKDHTVFSALMRGGLIEAAREMRLYNPSMQRAFDNTPCNICEKIFKDGKMNF